MCGPNYFDIKWIQWVFSIGVKNRSKMRRIRKKKLSRSKFNDHVFVNCKDGPYVIVGGVKREWNIIFLRFVRRNFEFAIFPCFFINISHTFNVYDFDFEIFAL